MEVFIKIAVRDFERLRSRVPEGSPAHEAIERATRIDYSVGGVLFEGYSIACDESSAHVLRQIASQHCPEILPKIEEAIRLAQAEQR
jgi:hypothetical protein